MVPRRKNQTLFGKKAKETPIVFMGDALITKKTKFTVCPAYKPRFEAFTWPFVHGVR